jgi:serine/threonine-protein kinase RsbW
VNAPREAGPLTAGIRLTIDSDLDKVVLLARAVRALCTGVLDSEEADAVELALVEAVNNVIRHGYAGRPGEDVEVSVALQPDQVVVEVVDHASPMDGALIEEASASRFDFDPADLDAVPESGMGLALIQMSMDEVEYRAEGGANRLRMVKRVRRDG